MRIENETQSRMYHESIYDFPCSDLKGCDLGFCKVGRLLAFYINEVSNVKNGVVSQTTVWFREDYPGGILPALHLTDFPASNLSLDEAERILRSVYCAFGLFSLMGKIRNFDSSLFDIDFSHLFAHLRKICNLFRIDTTLENPYMNEDGIDTYSMEVCKRRDILLLHEPSPICCMWSGQCPLHSDDLWTSLLSPPIRMLNSQSLLKQTNQNDMVQSHDIVAQMLDKLMPPNEALIDLELDEELLAYEYQAIKLDLPLIKTDDEDDEPEAKESSKPKHSKKNNNKRRKLTVTSDDPIAKPTAASNLDNPIVEPTINFPWDELELSQFQYDVLNLVSPQSLDGEYEAKSIELTGEANAAKSKEQERVDTIRIQRGAANDHSYYKTIESSPYNMASYGIDTPSDTEEDEIDVVSCSTTFKDAIKQEPKQSTTIEWHQNVVSALRNKNSIKTIMPVKTEKDQITLACSSKAGGKHTAKTGGNRKTSRGTKRKRKQGGSKTSVDKRDQHNDMERQRRVGIRVAYDHLKEQLPYDVRSKKISKVSILNESTKYARNLTATEAKLQQEIEALEKVRKQMKAEKNELIRYLNAERARKMG